jgi:hypothetical protein
MKMSLKDYAKMINEKNAGYALAIITSPDYDQPLTACMRYSASHFRDRLTAHTWDEINNIIDICSKGTMHISTSPDLFMKGIINVEIASLNHGYRESVIVGTLEHVVKALFC